MAVCSKFPLFLKSIVILKREGTHIKKALFIIVVLIAILPFSGSAETKNKTVLSKGNTEVYATCKIDSSGDFVYDSYPTISNLKTRTIINRAQSTQNLSTAIYGMPGFSE